jgi:hypothetical protein
MANTIRIDTRLLQVNWTTATTYRLALGAGLVQEVGNNRSFSAAQSNAKTFTTFNSGPTISAVTPAVSTTNSFVTTATITFNRTIYDKAAENFYLYKEVDGTDELIATLNTASSRVTRAENTVTIDLKNLVDSSSTYYLQSSNALFTDMFNFPNENLSETKFKYTTGRPNIDDVTPDFGTTGSFVTTATISYDRNIKKRSGNFYLYKEGVGSDTLVQTFSTSSAKVVVDGDDVSIDLRYLLNGESTYYITSDYGALDDQIANFRAEAITEEKFKYSTGPGPKPIAVTPAYASTGSFVSTSTITFDKAISLYSNTVYLYKNDTVYRTLPVGSSNLRIINSNTLEVTIYDQPIPEDVYYVGFDLGVVVDNNTFSAVPVADDSLVKWTSKSITDIPNDTYNSRITTPIFDSTWFNVLDRGPNANDQYTLTIIATSGTFTASGGISVGNTWIYTGTNQQISNIGGVNFIANVKDMNWDLPIQTTLAKQGVILAVRDNTIIGLPYDLDSMPLVSNSYTNIISSATVLTVSANTNSQFNGVDAGYVTFKAGTATIGISTFSNNISTLSLPAGQLPVGTYNIYADWAGRIIPPKFNGTLSNTISQTILPKSPITFSVTPVADFFYHNLDGSTYSSLSTATIKLSNIYPNAKPGGTVSLFDGDNFLGSDVLELEGSTSTAIITWNPNSESQVDQGNRNLRIEYAGDDWNLDAISTATFQARTRRQAILSLSASTSSYVRPTNITLNVDTTATFENKSLAFVATTGTASSGVYSSTQKTFTFDSRILTPGSNSMYAQFLQDFSYVSTNSNLATFTVTKGTPDTASLTIDVDSNTFAQPVLFSTDFGTTEAKGTYTVKLTNVSPYTIVPTEVVQWPYAGYRDPNKLVLKLNPIDRVKLLEVSDPPYFTAFNRVKLVFDNSLYNIVPGITTGTAVLVNPQWLDGSLPNDFYLELWIGNTQLGVPSNPISPLFNTSTWVNNTGTFSLIKQNDSIVSYLNTSTIIQTTNIIDVTEKESLLEIPYGYWKAQSITGSDVDSNYLAPNTATTHLARLEPAFNLGIKFYNSDSDSDWIVRSEILPRDFYNIPISYFSNKELDVKITYRVMPGTIPSMALPESESDAWQVGPVWKDFTMTMIDNTLDTDPAPRVQDISNTSPAGEGDLSVNYRNAFLLNLQEGTGVYITDSDGSTPYYKQTIGGTEYWVNGCFFEFVYNGSTATSTAVSIPNRIIQGYTYQHTDDESLRDAIITLNSTF